MPHKIQPVHEESKIVMEADLWEDVSSNFSDVDEEDAGDFIPEMQANSSTDETRKQAAY